MTRTRTRGTQPAAAERLEQFVRFSPDATVAVSGGGRIELVNAQAEILFGYGRDELIGQPVELLMPARFGPGHAVHRDGYFADPRGRPMGTGPDLRGRCRDGTEFPAAISLSSFESGDGAMVVAAVRDISDRRAAERVRAYLAAIVDSTDDAIIGKTVDGTIISWNAGAQRVYGYTAEEAIGQSISMVMPGEDAADTHRMLTLATSEDAIRRPETVGVCKDGRRRTMSLSVSAIRDESGQIAGVATIARDVTEDRAAQLKFERFVELAPDAIVGVGRDGDIMLVNAQTEALFGYPRGELIGQSLELLVPERFRMVHPGHRQDYLGDPRTRPMGADLDLFGRRKDGSEFPAEISLSSVGTGDDLMATAAIRDITERREAECEQAELREQLEVSRALEAYRETERLEAQLNQLRRLESVGQLAGGIAHDFNNILGIIINYARFAVDDLPEGSPARADIAEIERAAERAVSLTRQLLIFSRRDVVHPEVLDLNDVVAELDKLLRRALGEHVELTTRFADGLAKVEIDPGQIEQVLVNLAVNARDAMPTGGRLRIETANVELDSTFGDVPPGEYVRLMVSDTGVGMISETAHRAFEPFFSTKPKNEGTGLGLATVYGIVTEAGGNIQLYSEPGLGTTVRVYLPASFAAPSTPPMRPHRSPPRGRGETVLVVEDEEGVRQLTARILTRAGYEVLLAERGPIALELCRRPDQQIDLLLSDVVMPEMLGPDLVRRVHELRPDLPAMYMSGYAQPLSGAPDLEVLNDASLIEKPFTAEALLSRVRSVLDARHALTSPS